MSNRDEEVNSRLVSLLPKEEEEHSLSTRICAESKKLWVVAGPAILTRFAVVGVLISTQAFLGHVGSLELAGYALSFTVIDRFAVSILLGMASALETLCGQAFGAKQYHMLGVYLQRSWIILFACVILLVPVFIFATPLLELLGQDKAIAKEAGIICLWFIPVIFSHIFNFTFQMYLQSQSKNMVISYFSVFSFMFHLFLSWLMVIKFSWGLHGAMIAMCISMWFPVIGQFIYVLCGGCPETWKGFSWSAFSDLGLVAKLSLSSGLMICLELWYNSILILLTGNMENAEVELDALSICLNLSGWAMMIFVGLLAAAGVRVANELGAGNANATRFAIVNVVSTSAIIGVVIFVLFLVFQRSIAFLFTDSELVLEAVADLSPLLAFTILLQSIQPVLSGVAVGAGLQKTVANVNIACYYLVGVPLGVIFGYVIGYQIKGLWVGMLVGTLIQTAVLCYITWKMDWDKQVELARERVDKWFLPESPE
ncbi:Protein DETOXIFICATION [Rhynchospora pubera]|uniref:Protein DETOXIFICATION n=1 Tax=Rhynchospora pubera TaxID=906938 RepID=A0AAV8GUU7_9POAL|nr:Protein DETOXIFICATION [Rhynchospora pubera]